jgi:WD40 repeat protein
MSAPCINRPAAGRLRLVRQGSVAPVWIAASLILLAAGSSAILAQGKGAKQKAARPIPVGGAEPAATFVKFPDWTAAAAFTPDSKSFAVGSYGVIKLFDVGEKQETAALEDKTGFIKSLAFAADGRTLAAGSYQSVALWDVAEKKVARTLKGHRGYVVSLAFSPDGRTLATASDDETVRLWDLSTGESRVQFTAHEQPVNGVAFSPNGQLVASCSGDTTRPSKKGSVRVWDAMTGEQRWAGESHVRVVAAVAFSPDGSMLATAGHDEMIKSWDTASGKELKEFEGHTRPVNSVASLPSGQWLASCSGGRNVGGNELKLWDVAKGKDQVTIPAHEAPVTNLAVSPDGKWIVTTSLDKTAHLWDASKLLAAVSPPAEKKNESGSQPAAKEVAQADQKTETAVKQFKVGIIGLDTSHAIAFTQILNAADAKEDVSGCRVVAVYPKGSPDIVSSTSRVPEYTEKIKELGVEVVDSIDTLLSKVDVVLLETNDGRPHFEQLLPCLKAGKPTFIDKPIAGSLADAVAIFEAARKYKVPVWSASSLRYTPGAQEIRKGKVGDVKGADTYSPCSLEATHPDLYWYGIHGVESLFTVMGPGCESVTRVSTPGIDVAAGVWKGGRVGTFRGIRTEEGGGKAGYGGTVFGTKGVEQIGTYGGYRPLLVEIVKFFRTNQVPVAEEETLEIYAFMEAADESKRQGGKPVTLESVLTKAREEAKGKLAEK